MARFVTGNTFGTTDTVTAAKLNTAVNDAAISTDSVDNNTIELNSNALRLKDSSSKTTGVTFAKMQHISTAKVLGRASASEGDVEEAFDFKDEDDMSSNSATALSSQQSIKAYVDGKGITQTTGSAPYFGVRAWAHYNQVTDTVEASQNIASIVRTVTGYSTVTFTTAMPSDYYAVSIAGNAGQALGGTGAHTIGYITGTPSSTSFAFGFFNNEDGNQTGNNSIVTIIVIA